MKKSKRVEDSIGKKINMLTILRRLPNGNRDRIMVEAQCECGNIKPFCLNQIIMESTKSCGCLKNRGRETHGLTNHLLFKAWGAIIQRCYNPNNKAYKNYGKKNVTMCEEWLNDFKCFYDWAIANGWKKGLHIDKDIKWEKIHGTYTGMIYGPEYCTIVTPKENSRNRYNNNRVTINGTTKVCAEWSEEIGIHQTSFCRRIKKGWTGDKLLQPKIIKTKKISNVNQNH